MIISNFKVQLDKVQWSSWSLPS